MSPPSSRSSQIAAHLSGPSSSRAASTSSSRAPLLTPAPGLPQPHNGGGQDGTEPKVIISNSGPVFEIILNRHRALNALDSDMVAGIRGAIKQAGRDPRYSLILLRGGQGSRGLCSGGDVLKVVNMANSKDENERQAALKFFKDEFELDHEIAKLGEEVIEGSNPSSRSIISVMDGITMGGGVGLSVHAPFRIATEKTMFAMPETGIGYFPDVGVTRVLARLDGQIGNYLGLTGERISGEEAYWAGLATHFVPSGSLEAMYGALSNLSPGATVDQVASAIDDYTVNPLDARSNPISKQPLETSPFLGDQRIALDFVFGQSSMEDVFKALREIGQPVDKLREGQMGKDLLPLLRSDSISDEIKSWAKKTLVTLQAKSPRSLKVTHQAIVYEARKLDVDESFRFDMRLATAFCDVSIGRDFYEGVHHTLTKDPSTGKRRQGRASWSPASLEEVDDLATRHLFFGRVQDAQEKYGMKLTPLELSTYRKQPEDRATRRAREEALQGLGPRGWDPRFNAYHPLPSEAELEALLHGSHPSSGSLQIELEDKEASTREIIESLRGSHGGRRGMAWGLEKKVEDWRVKKVALMQARQQ